MDGLQPEDALILGVALIIVLNRAFTSTALKLRRPAYVAVQSFNLVTMAVLLQFRLDGYPPKLDHAIRVFLMFFVAWHMVLANQSRAAALRKELEEGKEHQRRIDEREKRMQQLSDWDAEAEAARAEGNAPVDGPPESDPVSPDDGS